MAYQLTPWGYEVDGPLPPLVSAEDFEDATDGRWTDDLRTIPAVTAASAAIRNACGWHVGPSMRCRATIDVDGLTRSVWLPARNVTAIESVTVGGVATDDYEWSRIGEVRFPHPLQRGLQAVVIEYVAGTCPGDLAALVAGIAGRSLALRPGVTSESAGGVSVSVSAAIAASASAPFLTDAERTMLMPYKVVRAHAT